jgi:hypothetical protein
LVAWGWGVGAPKPGTSSGIWRCFRCLAPQGVHDTEARQAESGPSVLALLTVSSGLVALILGLVWFVFFRI